MPLLEFLNSQLRKHNYTILDSLVLFREAGTPQHECRELKGKKVAMNQKKY